MIFEIHCHFQKLTQKIFIDNTEEFYGIRTKILRNTFLSAFSYIKKLFKKKLSIDFISIFQVVFKTDIYGTFRQTLVYDFGLEPVLSREMQIESAPITDIEKLSKDLVLSEQGRWKVESVDLVPFENK